MRHGLLRRRAALSRARGIKPHGPCADLAIVEALAREEVLARYEVRVSEFERIAASRPARLLSEPASAPPPRDFAHLSAREVEVLVLIAEGMTDAEASSLFLAPYTIKSHIKNLFPKLGARGRAQAVAMGFRRGILS